jgi:hypothetical protein
MMRKPCACPRVGQGFGIEKFEEPMTAAHIRNRIGLGAVNTDTAFGSWIRNRREEQCLPGNPLCAGRIQNRNHNMYQSQYVRHHLKADHRGKMMRNMMGEPCVGPDCGVAER